jgi:hypothetical protein
MLQTMMLVFIFLINNRSDFASLVVVVLVYLHHYQRRGRQTGGGQGTKGNFLTKGSSMLMPFSCSVIITVNETLKQYRVACIRKQGLP